MRVCESIFGSRSEQTAFSRIREAWSGKIDVYPSLPLANIIEASDDELSVADHRRLLRLSVDYCICEPTGRPIFGVEFDGIGDGITGSDGRYRQRRNRWRYSRREADMNFKLDLARRAGYPLIVVGEREVDPLGEGEAVTVLDGIIGSVLASRAFNAGYDDAVARVTQDIESPSSEDYVDALDDLTLEANADYNPLGLAWLNLPVGCMLTPWDEKRSGDRVGCTARIEVPMARGGEISRTVWVRDFFSEGLPVCAQSLATDLALHLATKEAHRVLWEVRT